MAYRMRDSMSDEHEYGSGLAAWRSATQYRGAATALIAWDKCPVIEEALEREATIPVLIAGAYETCRGIVRACLRPADNVAFVENRIRELIPADAKAVLNAMLIHASEQVRKDFVEAMVTISLAISARGGHVETDERGQAAGVVEAIDRLLVVARMEGAEEERDVCAKECDAVDDDAVRAVGGVYTGKAREASGECARRICARAKAASSEKTT
jgi:hypothetical protein